MYKLLPIQFVLFAFAWGIFTSVEANAQGEKKYSGKERKQLAAKHIKNLDQGTLIVRLPSSEKKIKAMQDLIDGGNIDDKAIKRLQDQIKRTREDTDQFIIAVMYAFQTNYHFSNLLFMLDTAAVRLNNGERQGFFLKYPPSMVELDPSLVLEEGKPYYVLRFGYTNQEDTQGIAAMIVTDEDGEDLISPFPYYVRLNNFSAILGGVFPAPEQLRKNTLRLVKKLDMRLTEFRGKVK